MKDGKYLILYVDDDVDLRDAMRLRLEKAGYGVDTAASAEQGLKVFKANRPDFILVDMMMEQVDAGMNLVKDLKLAGNQAPIYMLSSVGDQLNLSTDYKNLGLDGVFQKPIAFDLLVRTLEAKLGQPAR
jgi:two-component system, OmpR family, response regulator MtrA